MPLVCSAHKPLWIRNRILKQIDVSDIALCEKVVQNLMGEQVGPRRDFIAANAHKANIDL